VTATEKAKKPPIVDRMQSMVTNQLAKETFGANYQKENKGFLIPLQLFDVLWGIKEAGRRSTEIPGVFAELNEDTNIKYIRRSHDFARRLMNGDNDLKPERISAAFAEPEIHKKIIPQVLEALTVPDFYSRKKNAQANTKYFQPYLGQLIHHDFARRKNQGPEKDYLKLEGVYYRGAGLVAYDLYRTDTVPERREKIKIGFEKLVYESDSDPLGRLMQNLQNHDAVKDIEPYEFRTHFHLDSFNLETHQTKWAELLREGTLKILTSEETGQIKKVDHLMFWIPFCISRQALIQAAKLTGETEHNRVVIDLGVSKRLKRLSQQNLATHQSILRRAPIVAAEKALEKGKLSNQKITEDEKLILKKIADPNDPDSKTHWFQGTASNTAQFYIQTMAHIGGLNHNTGLRNYTFKQLGLLEAIVYATIEENEEINLDDYCKNILGQKLDLVIDSNSATDKLRTSVDTNDFENNKKALSDMLLSLGLLTNYSDAVKKVRRR
tara:strand:+ start:7037 stop:8521 length:1485 start_codon:yes stop_codon:yes gene_type:complete